MNELRAACAPYKSARSSFKGRCRVHLRTEEIAAAVDALDGGDQIGSFARAAWHFHRGETQEAIQLLRDMSAGGGVPGSAPPHRAAMYALRARCYLRRENLSEARNDVSRSATSAGIKSTSFAASAKDVDRHASCADEDVAYLVRLRARCDLLSVRLSKGLSVGRRETLLAAAAATLEAGGSPSTTDETSRLGSAERSEIEEEIRLAEEELEKKRGCGVGEGETPADERKKRPSSSSFAEYDARYRMFESSLSLKADGTVSLSELPLPPEDCSISGASARDPPDAIKAAVRIALLRWHPDKAASLAHYFVATDREALVTLSASLTRNLILEKRSLLS